MNQRDDILGYLGFGLTCAIAIGWIFLMRQIGHNQRESAKIYSATARMPDSAFKSADYQAWFDSRTNDAEFMAWRRTLLPFAAAGYGWGYDGFP